MSPYPIPVIDLAVATRLSAPAHLLAAVKTASERVGVIQVVNHGVPQDLIDDFSDGVGRLLDLPSADKARLASPTGHPYRGWRQWPDECGRLEVERFSVGQFDNATHARAAGLPEEYVSLYEHENVWPADDARLHPATHRYLHAARGVAERVLGLYARAQGLRADTFPASDLPYITLTVSNNPAWTRPGPQENEDVEHADGSAVTVLAPVGDYEGLQVEWADGDWVTVPIVPGALVVFSGTLLTRWTNGRLCPARHRVVAGGSVPRRSAGMFYWPALDAVIEPLRPFTTPGREAGYPPVTTWDLVKGGEPDYLTGLGRADQAAAWDEAGPYVTELADASAGR